MTPIVFGVFRRLRPVLVAAPVAVVGAHVVSVAHAEKHRAAGAVLIFMHFAGWVNDKGTGRDRNGFGWCPHCAATGKAEIDFGGLRVTMIGTGLSRLPAGEGNVTIGDFAKDFLDVMFWIPLLLAFKAEDVHGRGASAVRIDKRTFARARSSMVRADRS